MTTRYELHQVNSDSTEYGAEHIGARIDGYSTDDFDGYVVPWTNEEGDDVELVANAEGDLVLNDKVVATWDVQ